MTENVTPVTPVTPFCRKVEDAPVSIDANDSIFTNKTTQNNGNISSKDAEVSDICTTINDENSDNPPIDRNNRNNRNRNPSGKEC